MGLARHLSICTSHAAPSQNGNNILRHDLAGGVRGFDDSRSASFVSHVVLSRAQKARHLPSKSYLGLAPRGSIDGAPQ